MSDIEREEFEQAVTDRWSDSYSFTRFGDEDYYDEVLEGMWWGWQASRQEGEPIGFLQSSGVSQLSGGHPAKLYPIGATPSPFESSTPLYTHPASADKQAVSVPEWIKCSDRLPAEYDGDFEGLVWVNDRDMLLPKYAQPRVHWSRVRGIAGYTHWMPTGFRRPQPPKQEGE
jgi:hypothetical protein